MGDEDHEDSDIDAVADAAGDADVAHDGDAPAVAVTNEFSVDHMEIGSCWALWNMQVMGYHEYLGYICIE